MCNPDPPNKNFLQKLTSSSAWGEGALTTFPYNFSVWGRTCTPMATPMARNSRSCRSTTNQRVTVV